MSKSREMCRLALLTVAMGSILLGCSGDDDERAAPTTAPPSTTTTAALRSTTTQPTTTTTTTTTETPEAAVERVYLEIWMDLLPDLLPTNDVGDPRIETLLIEPARSVFVDEFRTRAASGVVGRLPDNSRFNVTVLSILVQGDVATVSACLVDDAVLFAAESGEIVDDDVLTARLSAEMHRIDGAWRAYDLVRVREREGVVPCDDV